MSIGLNRKASKGTLRSSVEDYTSWSDQKNSIISCLQAEVEQLRTNQQKYDRVKEELNKLKGKHEALLRDHQISCNNNQERLEMSARSVHELRLQSDQLENDLRLKGQSLKEAKFHTQSLLDLENRKDEECTQIKVRVQEQRNLAQVRKIEEERSRLQIAQMREEVDKGRKENTLIRNQTETLNEKSYKTQSYIRGLLREQSNLTESLGRIEDENGKLDASIGELDTMVAANHSQIARKNKDCEELQFGIANRELDKKKMENQIREKVKQLSVEKERWRNLTEQWELKKQEAGRFEAQVSQASAEINYIQSKNRQIEEINRQMDDDLQVCQRHLENVGKINKSLECEIHNLKEVSQKAISKLQEPFSNRTNTYCKWGSSSRVTTLQSGEWEKTYR